MEMNEVLLIPEVPCRGCSTRKSGCHAECTSYCDYKVEVEAYKAEIKRRKAAHLQGSKRIENIGFKKVKGCWR